MDFVAKAAAVAGVLLSAVLPAKSDVIFNFSQVGPLQGQPANGLTIPDLTFVGNLIVSDTAARDGFAYTLVNRGTSAFTSSSLTGLVGFGLSSENPNAGFGLPQLLTPVTPGLNSPRYSFDLSGSLATGLFGRLDYNNTEAEIGLNFAGNSFTGTFGADFQQGCTNPLCTYSGTITTSSTPTPVPEPASLALFGMGLAGLGLIRRKRVA